MQQRHALQKCRTASTFTFSAMLGQQPFFKLVLHLLLLGHIGFPPVQLPLQSQRRATLAPCCMHGGASWVSPFASDAGVLDEGLWPDPSSLSCMGRTASADGLCRVVLGSSEAVAGPLLAGPLLAGPLFPGAALSLENLGGIFFMYLRAVAI